MKNKTWVSIWDILGQIRFGERKWIFKKKVNGRKEGDDKVENFGALGQAGEGELGREGKDEHEEHEKDEDEVFILINFSFWF